VQCQVNLERLDVARLDVAHAIGKTLWQGGPGNHVGEYLLDVEVGDHRLPAQDFLAAVQNHAHGRLSVELDFLDRTLRAIAPLCHNSEQLCPELVNRSGEHALGFDAGLAGRVQPQQVH